jgi:hypothetical protein
MPDHDPLQEFLTGGHVDTAVLALRPDYRALLITVEGLVPGPSDSASDELLQTAEEAAREAMHGSSVEDLPHVTAWREAYRAFGAKPQRNPQQPGGATAARDGRVAPGQSTHRPVQRGLGAAPDPARR